MGIPEHLDRLHPGRHPWVEYPHNVPRSYWQGLATNLAVRLLADFGKEPTASLLAQATQSLSNISARVATVRPTPYPSRMPVGSGNRAVGRYNTFFNPAVQAPISSGTEVMVQNDVRDFVEHFDSYLNTGETVSSFTISADTGLTIVSSSLTTPDVNYRIKAIGTSTPANDPWLKLTIVATTSTGRIETRVKNFQVTA